MTIADHDPVTADEQRSVLLAPPRGALAPAAARRMRRALAAYAGVWAIGLLLALAGGATLGAGLALPGGGFLAAGSPLLFAAALVAFTLAMTTWWFAGPTVLPPLVWAGAAALAAATAGSPDDAGVAVAFALAPAGLALAALVHRARFAGHLRTREQTNARLAGVRFTITGPPAMAAGLPVTESSDEDLARLRYGLDLALQPLDRFDGFTKIDQYREAALRYQLNALAYGLAMSQFTRTPAFSGHLAEAQRNAIEKMLDRRVWGYWARENLWGNVRWNPDPVDTRENIMLTGFHGLMVGMYETLNDDRYSQPGALAYRWSDDRVYAHDYHSLAASIHRNMDASPFTLFACEPNWIYSVCNTFGLNTLVSHDRLHGSAHVDSVGDRLRAAYESDFIRPDGRIIGVRSAHLGLSWNFWAGEAVQLTTAFWMHAGLPDIAQRTWWLLRERSLRIDDGRLVFPSYPSAKLDPGNYTLTRDSFAQVVTAMAAREVGDEEYAVAAERTLAEREPLARANGVERWSEASGLVNLYGVLARFGRRSALRDLVAHGVPPQWRSGPLLADVAYPDVLVARAVSDGHALDLTLVPGDGPVRTTLAIERLVPHRRYARSDGGEDVVAGPDGRALVELELDRRVELRLS